jgi:hypothetical protein
VTAPSERKLATHVVAVLRQHPRRDELSLEEVSRLGEMVLSLLVAAVKCLDEGREQFPVDGDVGDLLYRATWVEAARIWRGR